MTTPTWMRGHRPTGAALALGVLLLAAALAPCPASAQTASEREIAESQRRLQQIREERGRLRDELDRIRSTVRDLSGEVRNLERQVSTSSDLLRELDAQLAQREQQIEENTRDLETTRAELASRRALLNGRLRDLYKRGPLQTAELLLTARSFSDLMNRYRFLYFVARHDRTLVQEISRLEGNLVTRERALRGNLAQLQELQLEKASEHEQLATLEQQRRRTLGAEQGRERSAEARMAELEADERRLAGLIETLEARRREAERAAERAAAAGVGAAAAAAPAPARATLSAAERGTLPWPVDGRILYRFGRATQPNGTILRWNGLGIAAPAGAQVRAVAGGTVVLAAPFEGYGPTVVVSHGDGYYSLYLYLREIRVRDGETVRSGDTVGTVGGERTRNEPHVEFQIRVPGGDAVDPLLWLREEGR